MTIHDTAGIRDTTDEVELEGIARARALAALTDVVIYVYISATSEQRFIDSFFATPTGARKLVCVRNKIDLFEFAPTRQMVDEYIGVSISAATGDGISLLRAALRESLEFATNAATSPMLARERYLNALRQADSMLDFATPQGLVSLPELSAERLRHTHHALGELAGETTNEDLLGAIF